MIHAPPSLGLAPPWTGVRQPPPLRGALTQLDDAELVALAGRGGDARAFPELIQRHQGKVRGLLLRLAGNRSLADDLAQEVFLRAYRSLAGFEGRSRFSTWLHRIAYNIFLNHRTRSRELAALPRGFESGAAAPESAMSPSRFDLRRDLEAALSTLGDPYRAVITLHYLEDASYAEIAETLGLPIGTVRTRLRRAKQLLRAAMPGWAGGRTAARDDDDDA